jgi:putative addiction module component (TIGR02574 family)
MTAKTQTVFEAAMALPEPERLLLVERLLDELSPDADTLNDDELANELNRRKKEFESGTADPIPWSRLQAEE